MEQINIEQILKETFFKPEQVKELQTLVTIQEKIIASEGGIISIGGLPKARKSTFMFGLLSAICSGREVFNFRAAPGKTLLIDTEQTSGDFFRHLKTFYGLSGLKKLPKDIAAFLFRKYDIEIIKQGIEKAVEMMKPKYLFLDSITDLVYNVNDFEETKKFTKWLMKLSTEHNVCIVCLIHLSKTNNFTLGALGSAMDRVSQSTLIVTKDKETQESILSPLFLRSSDDFQPVSISYNNTEDRYEVNQYRERKKSSGFDMGEINKDQHRSYADIIFRDQKLLDYKALISAVQNLYGIGDTYARRKVVPYLIQESIIINREGKYSRM